jgi:hypothetical protein
MVPLPLGTPRERYASGRDGQWRAGSVEWLRNCHLSLGMGNMHGPGYS